MLKPKDAQLQQEQLPDRTWIKKKKDLFFFFLTGTWLCYLGVEGGMGGGKMRAMPLLCEIQIMGKDVVMLNIY